MAEKNFLVLNSTAFLRVFPKFVKYYESLIFLVSIVHAIEQNPAKSDFPIEIRFLNFVKQLFDLKHYLKELVHPSSSKKRPDNVVNTQAGVVNQK